MYHAFAAITTSAIPVNAPSHHAHDVVRSKPACLCVCITRRYGVDVEGDAMTLKFVTKNADGTQSHIIIQNGLQATSDKQVFKPHGMYD